MMDPKLFEKPWPGYVVDRNLTDLQNIAIVSFPFVFLFLAYLAILFLI